MGRFEYKYLVPDENLSDIRKALLPFVEIDAFTEDISNDYCVHSIYYDTHSLDFYKEKNAGIRIRKKLRIRGYNELHEDSLIFLEIKRKDDKLISKNRAPLLFNNIQNLITSGNIEKYIIRGNGNPNALDDGCRFFYHINRHSLFPVINIHYKREAYFYKFDKSVRITFDKNLHSSANPRICNLFNETSSVISLKGYFILEVKFSDTPNGMPQWLKNIIEMFCLRRSSLSKYCICMDAHKIPQCQYNIFY
jgi:SPX domain protein involved in polyphosphate accumulation